MKNFLKMIVVFAAVSFTQLAVAREALLEATIKDIKVTSIAPAVQEQLNKASPEERKGLEAAIHTGNLFIPQYFSGNAFDSDPENVDWERETRPLISADREEWEQQYEQLGMNRRTVQAGKETVYTTRLTCPQVSLISVQQTDFVTTLLYRTTSIGTLIDNNHDYLFDFNLEGAGDIYGVHIVLDKSNSLVDKVVPPDQWVTWSYTMNIAFMNRFLGDHGTAVFSTKEHENLKIRTYQSTIQKIRKSAAKFCK